MNELSNPRLYFTIDKKLAILRPVRTQNTQLDKLFADVKVLNNNKQGYNEYTRNYIKDNINAGEILWTEHYSWDAFSHTFNFSELNINSDEDYEKMSSETCEFDPNSNYNDITTTVEYKIKSRTILDDIREKHPCPSIESGFYVEEKNWNFLVRNIMKHVNTILIGPTGTGKTEIIQKICASLNIPCRIYDMGSMQDPLTDLLGSHRLENGSSVFDYAKFVQDVQEPGVILLDELSRAPLMTNNILFPCLDGRRTLPVEIADSKHDRVIKVHPDCTFIATANIGSEYSGTNDIDAALLNRFLPIQLDYLPENIETKIINIRTGLDNMLCKKLVNFVNKVRVEYSTGQLSKSVSTREILACAELIVDGFDLMTAIDFIITNKYTNNNYSEELTYVKKLIMGF